MARRVSIGKHPRTPFAVSQAGYDSASAFFPQLLFDANQQPLRLLTIGYIGPIESAEIRQGIRDVRTSSPVFTPSSGRLPVTLTMIYGGGAHSPPYISILNPKSAHPIFFSQRGGGISVVGSGHLWGLNATEKFQVSTPNGPVTITPDPIYICYALMKNMG